MIIDAFGNQTNDDGTPLNTPLEGTLIDLGNNTNNFGGGVMRNNLILKGKLVVLDEDGNTVILMDANASS